ncbi:M23 family metallopeptidase [Bombiscardovia apis]|uniref:M23 family metallopeptidase n=1 Tax=Bombiscardovia apis TaxID=2932182 RepID=UPI0029531AE2|nr:M23 family metallopeptidase [Bombiscardovia apis]
MNGEFDQRKRRKCQELKEEYQSECENYHRLGFLLCFLLVILFLLPVHSAQANMASLAGASPQDLDQSGSASCTPAWSWPVLSEQGSSPDLISGFRNPPQPWIPGHRGVDFHANPGQPIIAPHAGRLSFAGKVGGKDVVSMQIGKYTTTFEPAVSMQPVGSQVQRGEAIATVSGVSDHCENQCLHWGVKLAARTYVNPLNQVHPHRIVLKP